MATKQEPDKHQKEPLFEVTHEWDEIAAWFLDPEIGGIYFVGKEALEELRN
jgi:hypothetical protein